MKYEDRATFNPKKYMVFYKDGGLFETEMHDAQKIKAMMQWQKKGGFNENNFIICHYDYMNEEFFNEDVTLGYDDINRGVMKERVLTKFRAEFFTTKLTQIINEKG
jgi:hypothetical protein